MALLAVAGRTAGSEAQMIYVPLIVAGVMIVVAIAHQLIDTADIAIAIAGLALSLLWYRLSPLEVPWGEVWTLPLGAAGVLWGVWRGGVFSWLLCIPSSQLSPAGDFSPLDSTDQTTQRIAQYPIATPQTEHNGPIVFDPAIVRLAELCGDDPRDVDRAVLVLGRLLVARKKSGDPILGVTDAIRYGLRISPGSKSPKYAAAKEAIDREVARLAVQDGPQFADGIGGVVPASYPVSERPA
jgi:hypothetical protein